VSAIISIIVFIYHLSGGRGSGNGGRLTENNLTSLMCVMHAGFSSGGSGVFAADSG
jgi:hypothetical protein